MRISIREIEKSDIEHIANYWLNASKEFLTGMGVDLEKLPQKSDFAAFLNKQIESDFQDKESFAMIGVLDKQAIGHCNITDIEMGQTAKMHLHIWNRRDRQNGYGVELVKRSIPFFFKNFELEELISEPYALNPAPNKTLEKIGFRFIKKYHTIPGSLSSEQEVKRWRMSLEEYREKIELNSIYK